MSSTEITTGCKHCNAKCHLSFDSTTVCPKVRRGTPCIYCYVESSRAEGFRSKAVIVDDVYDGWVMRMRPETVDLLKSMGGLRMFSFGDYMRKHRKEVEKFLNDCQRRGVPVKAITKVVRFVYDWHDHPAISVINVSIDNVKKGGRSPITLETALELRKNYRKLRVRAVVLSEEDLKFFGKNKRVDILTLNHGRNGFKSFGPADRKAAAEKYPGRVCCLNTTCAGCEVLCGAK